MTIAATALTLILLAFRKGRELKSIRGNVNHFLVMGALLAIHFMLFISAVKDTSILNATVLVNTAPIFSTIISALFYRTKPSKLALAGMTMSSAGASLLAYGDFEQGEPASLVGDLEATLAAIAEGFYLNYGREKRRQISLLPAMLSIYLIAAFSVGTTMVVTRTPLEIAANPATLLSVIGIGVLPTATAHTLYFSSLSHLKSFETATMALLEPLEATFLGIAAFYELPTPIFIIGVSLVLVGIFSIVKEDNLKR